MTRKAEAAKAHAALLALDLNMAERRELAAAGVDKRRIDVLYPEEGFKSLSNAVIEHIQHVDPRILAQSRPKDAGRISAIADGVPVQKYSVTHPQSPWVGQKEMEDGDFHDGLEACMALASSTFLNYSNLLVHVYFLARSIFWADWAMTHRSELSWGARRQADRLMLSVAGALELSKSPEAMS